MTPKVSGMRGKTPRRTVDIEAPGTPGAAAAAALAIDDGGDLRGLHRRAASLSLTATATTPHSGA